MIFLLKKKKKKKTIVSRHMQFLHLINTRQYYLKIITSASFQSGLELEVLFSLCSVDCAQRQRMSTHRKLAT